MSMHCALSTSLHILVYVYVSVCEWPADSACKFWCVITMYVCVCVSVWVTSWLCVQVLVCHHYVCMCVYVSVCEWPAGSACKLWCIITMFTARCHCSQSVGLARHRSCKVCRFQYSTYFKIALLLQLNLFKKTHFKGSDSVATMFVILQRWWLCDWFLLTVYLLTPTRVVGVKCSSVCHSVSVSLLVWWDWPLTWWTDQLLSFSAWHCWLGHLARKNRPQYDLQCVWWDVKPYSTLYPF